MSKLYPEGYFLKDYAEIAVQLPLERTFTYSIPPELRSEAEVGRRVLVPFGKRTVTGYILSLTGKAPEDIKEVRSIIDLLDPLPIFDEKRLAFYRWIASYYFAPIGEVLALTHPGGMNVRSSRQFTSLAPQSTMESRKDIEREILSSAAKGVSLATLESRFKNRPVHSAIERLKKAGLLHEEVVLKGGGRERTENFASLAGSETGPPDDLKRSPIQAKVFSFLLEHGEASFTELRECLGNVTQAVRKLEEKGLVKVEEKRVLRNPFADIVPKESPKEPNPEQQEAIDAIIKAIRAGTYSPFLLYGVTGSGKTLVYLKIMEEAIRLGKKAVFLAPEISLTPWPAAYLADLFPGKVAIAHSGLPEGERYDEWSRVLSGEVDIVVGARSALFSPLKDLGLIIVDEEHETSYKQEDGVRYNARDAAIALAKHLGITVVLGSATPSIETYYNSLNGKLNQLVLRNRANNASLPRVELMDMKGKKGEVLSERLASLISGTLSDGHQALLFLNRRGFSNFILCRDCGETFSCMNCAVTLTMHKRGKVLKCHYCDSTLPLPDVCPKCSSHNLIPPGIGTEKVEEEVKNLFPEARVGRMDRDTTVRKGSARKIIEAVEERKVNILIGTQMVSKGHHFPGITLVGVIAGDTSLNIPDFRSAERTFQLITQASGRAGRGEIPGMVVIQTANPGHYSFQCASEHDYGSFYSEEIKIREEAAYPPFTRLCVLRVEGNKEEKVAQAAKDLKRDAEAIASGRDLGVVLLGPVPALIPKVRNRYRWQMLVKGDSSRIKEMHAFLKALKNSFDGRAEGVNLLVDMDPVTTA